jgi:hypothetical protein
MPTSPRTSPGSAAWQFVLPSPDLGQGGDIACGSKTETEVLSDDDPRGVQRPEHGIDELGPSIRCHRDRRLDQRRLRYTTTAARQMAAAFYGRHPLRFRISCLNVIPCPTPTGCPRIGGLAARRP